MAGGEGNGRYRKGRMGEDGKGGDGREGKVGESREGLSRAAKIKRWQP
jgi:hypothetical protein